MRMMTQSKIEELLNNIPDKFTINGQEFKVSAKPEVSIGDEPRLGLTHLHRENPEIQLALTLGKNWPLSKATVLNTYYHELFHVLLTNAGIIDTEVKVQSLANVFMQYEMSRMQEENDEE